MKKTAIVFLAIVMVILAITATGCTNTTTSTFENVYSETREALKEKCKTLLGEDEKGRIVTNFFSGKPVEIYYNGYSVEGPYNSMLYNAMVTEAGVEETQNEAILVLNRLQFFVEDDKIIYKDTLSEDFASEKANVTSMESYFKDSFKKQLKEFIEEETGAEIEDHYLKVWYDNGYAIRYVIQAKDWTGVDFEREYHVYFHGNYDELKKVATALMEGEEIRLPEYEYELTHYYYIEVTVK